MIEVMKARSDIVDHGMILVDRNFWPIWDSVDRFEDL